MFAITDTELVQMSEEAVQNIPIREDDPASPLPSGIIRALALGPQNVGIFLLEHLCLISKFLDAD